MNYDIVYIVVNEGEVEYVSVDEELAEAYADNQMYDARQEVLDEWGNDDPTDKDIAEADFQVGFDGGCYKVVEVNICDKTEDDIIELLDGSEIEVRAILKKLDEDEKENIFI